MGDTDRPRGSCVSRRCRNFFGRHYYYHPPIYGGGCRCYRLVFVCLLIHLVFIFGDLIPLLDTALDTSFSHNKPIVPSLLIRCSSVWWFSLKVWFWGDLIGCHRSLSVADNKNQNNAFAVSRSLAFCRPTIKFTYPIEKRYQMSFELATQVSALVGTSVVLFLVTQPRHDERHPKDSSTSQDEDDDSDSDGPHHLYESDRHGLKGIRRYSSYHRKRLNQIQSFSSGSRRRTMSNASSTSSEHSGYSESTGRSSSSSR